LKKTFSDKKYFHGKNFHGKTFIEKLFSERSVEKLSAIDPLKKNFSDGKTFGDAKFTTSSAQFSIQRWFSRNRNSLLAVSQNLACYAFTAWSDEFYHCDLQQWFSQTSRVFYSLRLTLGLNPLLAQTSVQFRGRILFLKF